MDAKDTNRKVRVAILGGGCGAMTAANYLSSTPELRDRFEVTVYQQGWRLGGKGATGRDPRRHFGDRVYEHGLHMWLGWYHNAFHMIQEVYAEWKKKPDNPFQSWRDAFEPQWLYSLQQNYRRPDGEVEWHTRNIPMPRLPGTPGQGEGLLEIAQLFEKLVHSIEGIFRHHSGLHEHRHKGLLDFLNPVKEFEDLHRLIEGELPPEDRAHPDAHEHLRPVIHGAARLRQARHGDAMSGEQHSMLLAMLDHFLGGFQRFLHSRIIRAVVHSDATRTWYWELLDFLTAAGLGMVRDVIPNGVASINPENFHEWLGRHGADEATRWSAGVRAVYDLAFAFEGGVASASDPGTAKFEAGSALMVDLRIGLGYKEAPMFRMRAGMGDTIFAPIYEVLAKQRGVKFEFFKRVTNLALSEDGKQIEAIDLEVQAEVRAGPAGYDPLFDLRFGDGAELPVWPKEPFWDQLVDGERIRERLAAADTTLESAWCHEKAGTQRLVNGSDFDIVVLGISVAGVKMITPELGAANAAWRKMVESLATVQTHASQMWMKPSLEELGWTEGDTIQTTYAEPTDTWAVMTEVLNFETWDGNDRPRSLHYFCGPLAGPAEPPVSDPEYPAAKKAEVKSGVMSWLDDHVGHLWPAAMTKGGFNYDLVHDPDPTRSGTARFDSQYWRANVDPSERYVNSFPGTSVYRLRSEESGFTNLFLAGDWTVSSVNAGCVEAAVESGMAAARAISGVPAAIPNYPES